MIEMTNKKPWYSAGLPRQEEDLQWSVYSPAGLHRGANHPHTDISCTRGSQAEQNGDQASHKIKLINNQVNQSRTDRARERTFCSLRFPCPLSSLNTHVRTDKAHC